LEFRVADGVAARQLRKKVLFASIIGGGNGGPRAVRSSFRWGPSSRAYRPRFWPCEAVWYGR